ncbi:carboxymuconolactone decarboxylase family protein [Listeria seeligeri]|uniref:carboxymuconolactone decarboxylase family protein n=1 Tax=Listeria seeligeri TaxID=1640 RepID=UPI0001C4E944|nr:carboxymuconolactone decarboxylase family protein [Listeria seeligeri]CBH28602.1 carboxymuconolactone decarboxylase family protein [Listeria seeligeri serovar 1/2b str. SLCC3954]
MKKQTAGRNNLGEFAPQFAALNDDVLFGEVWAREAELSPRDRSLITVSSLLTQGVPQLEAHLKIAKENGVTKEEIVALITHLAFYIGWPKAWSAFNLAKEIFDNDED